MNLDKIIKKFLLNESFDNPDVFSYIQSIEEILSRLKPKTLKERRDLSIARIHIKEIRKNTRKLIEENKNLQEQVKILENKK